MQITFNIEYHTRWGQQLCISGGVEALGSHCEEKARPMHYADDGWWTLTIDVDTNSAFTYRYMVREDGDVSRKE